MDNKYHQNSKQQEIVCLCERKILVTYKRTTIGLNSFFKGKLDELSKTNSRFICYLLINVSNHDSTLRRFFMLFVPFIFLNKNILR